MTSEQYDALNFNDTITKILILVVTIFVTVLIVISSNNIYNKLMVIEEEIQIIQEQLNTFNHEEVKRDSIYNF